jgi:hypothetical protein
MLLLIALRNESKRPNIVSGVVLLLRPSPSPELEQVLSLDLEQATLDRGSAAQAPQQACQSKHEFSFDRGPSIIVGRNRHLERRIVFGVL